MMGYGQKIVFMGTPAFAVASLDALRKAGYTIVGVVTAPDKLAGRGLKMNTSAVKNYAVEHGLNILQPEKLKNPVFIEELSALNADLQVVVAFRMLPEIVWNMPPLGTINVHASLLPKYRGAAPINWAIINGEKETGVTTFKLTHEIDTGNILLKDKVDIGEEMNAGELQDVLKETGAQLLIKTLTGIFDGSIDEQSQHLSDSKLPHAPKISTDTCRIDWNKSAEEIFNLIRGLSPLPGAFTHLNGKIFKIHRAGKYTTLNATVPGTFETDNRLYLRFACGDGYIDVKELQPEGKKRMNVEDFLRGSRLI